MKALKSVLPTILYHHEHFDGSGYPDGLAGEAIPIEARIIAVSDTFDNTTHENPLGEQKNAEEALREMEKRKGIELDGNLVEIFIKEKVHLSIP